MRAYITLQKRMHPRFFVSLNREEVEHLIAGSRHPRAIIAGNTADGLQIYVREDAGMAFTIRNGSVTLSAKPHVVRASSEPVGTMEVAARRLRDERGPYLQTGRLPLPFIDARLLTSLGHDPAAVRSQVPARPAASPAKPEATPSPPVPPPPSPPASPQPPLMKPEATPTPPASPPSPLTRPRPAAAALPLMPANGVRQNVVPPSAADMAAIAAVRRVEEGAGNEIAEVKAAILMFNDAMTRLEKAGFADAIDLRLEDRRLRAQRPVIKMEDL